MIHRFDTLDSTNTKLRELALAGAPEGTVVLARAQTAGRGRQGNAWLSEPGKNLLFSLLLRPPQGAKLGQLTAVMGVALRRAAGEGVQLKWPNDLWAGPKKLAGLLLETADGAVIAGIGLNVNQRRFEGVLEREATSPAILRGADQDLEALLQSFLGQADALYSLWRSSGFGSVLREWNENACFMGQMVEAAGLSGRMLGMNEEGALRLDTGQGEKAVHSGEVRGLRLSLTEAGQGPIMS